MQRDALGYLDGISLYEYTGSNPVIATDPTGGCERKTEFAPGMSVVMAPKATGDCGGAFVAVAWEIPRAYKNDWGSIVQMVTMNYDVKDCNNNPIDVKKHTNGSVDPAQYPAWEGWTFENGVVKPQSDETHYNDHFSFVDQGPCTKGTITMTGETKGIVDWPLPADFVSWGIPPFGDLWVTHTRPKNSGDGPKKRHTLKATWNCCPGSRQPTHVTLE